MQSKGLRGGIQGKWLNIVDVLLLLSWNRTVVKSTGGELIALLKNAFVNICPKDGDNKPWVLIISDSTSIVDFSTNVVESLIRNNFVSLNEGLQLSPAHDKVFISEGIWDVPPDRSEFSSVLYNSVEEGETKEKLFVGLGLCALFKVLYIKSLIGTKNILPETTWWLQSHLDWVLQCWNGELWCGHRCEPQTEITMIAVI